MLELSIMNHGARFVEEARALLTQFEQDTHIEVNLRVLEWRDAWAELVRVALYNDGPHISEIGNTWLSEFISMNALRPFVGMEVSRLGGAQQFLPSAWHSVDADRPRRRDRDGLGGAVAGRHAPDSLSAGFVGAGRD